MSSRLFQEIREKRGLCYTIYASVGSFDDTGLLTIYAGTSADLPDLIGLTVDELKRTASDFSPAELDRARAQMKAGLLMGLESPRPARNGWRVWWRSGTVSQAWKETVARIDGVTLEGLRRHGAELAQAGRAAMASYGPVGQAQTLTQVTERLAA